MASGAASQFIANSNERELLRRIWREADANPTTFVCLDTEFKGIYITELGLAIRTKKPPAQGRHLIITSNQALKRKSVKPFSFGRSETVNRQEDLHGLLTDLFNNVRSTSNVVVLVGHDVINDLRNLETACGWVAPQGTIVLDTQNIWRAWIGTANNGNLAQALGTYKIDHEHSELHNAGNDAWYSMELLVRQAEQLMDPASVSAPFPLRRWTKRRERPQRDPRAATTAGSRAAPVRSAVEQARRGTEERRRHKLLSRWARRVRESAPTPDADLPMARAVTRSQTVARRSAEEQAEVLALAQLSLAGQRSEGGHKRKAAEIVDLTASPPPYPDEYRPGKRRREADSPEEGEIVDGRESSEEVVVLWSQPVNREDASSRGGGGQEGLQLPGPAPGAELDDLLVQFQGHSIALD